MSIFKIIIVLMVTVVLTSCTSSSYLSRADKVQMLSRFEQKINQEIGGQYGSLIVKLDLLQLEKKRHTDKPDRCPVSPIYAAVNTSSVTREQFDHKIQQLDARFEEKRQKNLLHAILHIGADKKITSLKNVIRSTKIAPSDLRQDAVASSDMLSSIIAEPASRPQGGPYIPVSYGDRDGISLFAKLAYLDSISSISDSIPIVSPLAHSRMTSGFSIRHDPVRKKQAFHEGIDLAGENNARVISAASGRVVSTSRSGAYGNLVVIDHGLGITTRYAHLKMIFVRDGERVGVGQVIGLQGNTGRTTGAHLHFEVRINERPLNPAPFLSLGKGCML